MSSARCLWCIWELLTFDGVIIPWQLSRRFVLLMWRKRVYCRPIQQARLELCLGYVYPSRFRVLVVLVAWLSLGGRLTVVCACARCSCSSRIGECLRRARKGIIKVVVNWHKRGELQGEPFLGRWPNATPLAGETPKHLAFGRRLDDPKA